MNPPVWEANESLTPLSKPFCFELFIGGVSYNCSWIYINFQLARGTGQRRGAACIDGTERSLDQNHTLFAPRERICCHPVNKRAHLDFGLHNKHCFVGAFLWRRMRMLRGATPSSSGSTYI